MKRKQSPNEISSSSLSHHQQQQLNNNTNNINNHNNLNLRLNNNTTNNNNKTNNNNMNNNDSPIGQSFSSRPYRGNNNNTKMNLNNNINNNNINNTGINNNNNYNNNNTSINSNNNNNQLLNNNNNNNRLINNLNNNQQQQYVRHQQQFNNHHKQQQRYFNYQQQQQPVPPPPLHHQSHQSMSQQRLTITSRPINNNNKNNKNNYNNQQQRYNSLQNNSLQNNNLQYNNSLQSLPTTLPFKEKCYWCTFDILEKRQCLKCINCKKTIHLECCKKHEFKNGAFTFICNCSKLILKLNNLDNVYNGIEDNNLNDELYTVCLQKENDLLLEDNLLDDGYVDHYNNENNNLIKNLNEFNSNLVKDLIYSKDCQLNCPLCNELFTIEQLKIHLGNFYTKNYIQLFGFTTDQLINIDYFLYNNNNTNIVIDENLNKINLLNNLSNYFIGILADEKDKLLNINNLTRQLDLKSNVLKDTTKRRFVRNKKELFYLNGYKDFKDTFIKACNLRKITIFDEKRASKVHPPVFLMKNVKSLIVTPKTYRQVTDCGNYIIDIVKHADIVNCVKLGKTSSSKVDCKHMNDAIDIFWNLTTEAKFYQPNYNAFNIDTTNGNLNNNNGTNGNNIITISNIPSGVKVEEVINFILDNYLNKKDIGGYKPPNFTTLFEKYFTITTGATSTEIDLIPNNNGDANVIDKAFVTFLLGLLQEQDIYYQGNLLIFQNK
ncbi:hypothetical protein ABK040_013013 [Willaertia magna]